MHPLNPVLASAVISEISADARRSALRARAARAVRESRRRRAVARRVGSPAAPSIAEGMARVARA